MFYSNYQHQLLDNILLLEDKDEDGYYLFEIDTIIGINLEIDENNPYCQLMLSLNTDTDNSSRKVIRGIPLFEELLYHIGFKKIYADVHKQGFIIEKNERGFIYDEAQRKTAIDENTTIYEYCYPTLEGLITKLCLIWDNNSLQYNVVIPTWERRYSTEGCINTYVQTPIHLAYYHDLQQVSNYFSKFSLCLKDIKAFKSKDYRGASMDGNSIIFYDSENGNREK